MREEVKKGRVEDGGREGEKDERKRDRNKDVDRKIWKERFTRNKMTVKE